MKIEKEIGDLTEFLDEIKPYLELANNDMVVDMIKGFISSYLKKPSKEVENIFDEISKILIKKFAKNKKLMLKELMMPYTDDDKFCFTREEAAQVILAKMCNNNESSITTFFRMWNDNIKQSKLIATITK